MVIGIAGLWARTITVTRTTVAVQAVEEDEIPEEYEFVDGITENNGVDDYYASLGNWNGNSRGCMPGWKAWLLRLRGRIYPDLQAISVET
ncbi:MAG: hypothetical protein LUE14_03395 [Clostridiales bacterium]|nr:hypothetical protein [Clostridiales bacterium]MCD8109130.1 hypothetical protein [Clostridiales bacterium]MCD8132601.1 hypothetical protein [Clostridiales bacterium]